ncbi:MAG: DedA family protein, partial [Firmicutes bacterium]|nr:DedA family protein [Bacillota bacterium]
GYLAIGVAMLAEGLTLPCPALIVLLMAGAACAAHKMDFWLAAFIASTSYTLGALVPYYIGYNLPRLQNLPWAGRFIATSLQALEQVYSLFGRHGEKIVALMRPFWIGNLVSYFAGLNRMPYYKFLSYTFVGISAWSASVIFIGQVFSSNLPKAAALIKHYSGIAFLLLLVVLMGSWLLFRLRQSKQSLPVTRD